MVKGMNGGDRLEKAHQTAWRQVMKEKPRWSYGHMLRRCEEALYGLEVAGKSVLEVGAGDGFLSHYLVEARKAARVVSLDEYAGHGFDRRAGEINQRMREILGDGDRVEIVRADFLSFHSDARFDLVAFINVVHHIVPARKRLSRSREHFEDACRLFRHASSLLSPGGQVLVQEIARVNLCPHPGYRRSMSNVDFTTKQFAGEWKKALEYSGLRDVSVRYRLPLVLPDHPWLRRLFDNPLASLLADSSYVIRARQGLL